MPIFGANSKNFLKMKKLLLLTVATLAISFASCKKDRVCTCTNTDTTTYTGISLPTETSSSIDKTTYTKASKKAGKVNCVSYKGSVTQDLGGGASSTTVFDSSCSLS